MRPTLATALALALLPLFAPPAGAVLSPCDGPASGSVSIGANEDTYYVDHRGNAIDVYEESNGVEGLQRVPIEACGDAPVTPDARIVHGGP